MRRGLLLLLFFLSLAIAATAAYCTENVVELWRGGGFFGPESISVNPTDGSCWVADTNNGQVVHLAQDGTELWRGGGFSVPKSVSVNPTDRTCWVADTGNNQVVHLAANGAQLWRSAGSPTFNAPWSVSVNPVDGSCLVADEGNGQVVHLSENGTQLWRVGGLSGPVYGPTSVSVNPTDSSCWVADLALNRVVHLAQNGTELWHGQGLSLSWSAVSVNPSDGSCWVTDSAASRVVHLAANGSQLWQGTGFWQPGAASVNPADGSCWVADTGNSQTVHLAVDGAELWRSAGFPTFSVPQSVSVNPADGSCWVADTGNNQVAHLGMVTAPVADFSGQPTGGMAPLLVTFADLSTATPTWAAATSWQWSFGDGSTSTAQNPTHQYASPGTYTVGLTVSNAGGAASKTKPRYLLATFLDVPLDHWALHQIIDCVDAGIVKGYPDGSYQPTGSVTRDQMAVYISRALAGGDASVPAFAGTPSFSDVDASNWALKYVQYAVSNGVVKGYSDGTYKPTDQVDRGQMSVFIARAIATPTAGADLVNYTPPATASFPDVPTSFWAYKYVEYIKQADVTGGYPDGKYHPENTCTRDQMAVYVARAFQLPTAPSSVEASPMQIGTGGKVSIAFRVLGAGAGSADLRCQVTTPSRYAFTASKSSAPDAGGSASATFTYPDDFAGAASNESGWYSVLAYWVVGGNPTADAYGSFLGTYNITDYWPLDQGDTWNYIHSESWDGTSPQTAVVSGTTTIGGQVYSNYVKSNDRILYYLVAADGVHCAGQLDPQDQTQSMLFIPPVVIPNSLFPGQSVAETTTVTVNGVEGTMSVSLDFPGVETVTVPAGTFPACMKVDMHMRLTGQPAEDHITQWLAKGIGKVKEYEVGTDGGIETRELTSATIAGVTYP